MSEKTEANYKETYKETLNLPNTVFPMKANLSSLEPHILKKWEELDLYPQLLKKNHGKATFILADGPPYANGDIHIGHAVNKILKDMVVKSKFLSGFSAPFVPGWDCHGLPIELNVEREFGKPGDKLDAKTFRAKCREYVLKQVDAQRHSFIRLGVIGDWANPYLTMNPKYEANIVRSLAKIASKGHLHKGYKPVHWCVDCGSALAEAEVEYQDKVSPAIDVGFFVKNTDSLPFKKSLSGKKVAFVIWTTTPWTLPANEAVAVHPEHQYAILKLNTKEIYSIVVSELVDTFLKRMGENAAEILETVSGKTLEGLKLAHPFYDREVSVVLSDHVTLETGTGCVHIAPAHGPEDYEIGLRYQLPIENPVGANGCFISTTPLFAGEHVFKSNDKIIAVMKEKGTLFAEEKLNHSYPHCWRHKTALIFRATQQWFVSMDQKGLREEALSAIKHVEWIPNWGQARIEKMMGAGRPDWCISRQRTWGVPLCLFLHKETGELHPNTPELMEKIAQRMETAGIDAWHDLEISELLDSKEAALYEKSQDSLDVWFDSGVSHYCVLEKRAELAFPANLYLEGSDQHRGWFQSSLLTSVAMNGTAPYHQVLTHGFAVDPQGRKMSKSLGNVVAPEKVVKTLGADILRLWVSATDYRAEMSVSDEILKRTSDTYRRIRNTARFLLANLNGFDPQKHRIPSEKLLALDSWMLQRTQQIQKEIIQAYQEYNFHIIYQKLHNFCSIDLGSFYLDIIKDRQYTGQKEGIPRRSAQTVLFHIINAVVRWMAPILSFTAEEIFENLPGEKASSVFLTEWYTDFPVGLGKVENELTQDNFWQTILMVRDAVNKALEKQRQEGEIGSGLEAEVSLYCDASLKKLLSKLQDELRFVLITSGASVESEDKRPLDAVDTEVPGLWLKVIPSTHEKCVRCWHHREDVNHSNSSYPGLCARCVENVAGKGEIRHYA